MEKETVVKRGEIMSPFLASNFPDDEKQQKSDPIGVRFLLSDLGEAGSEP